jgi:hypothetical protein
LSAAKIQAESATAIHLDLIRPQAFAAQPLAAHRQTIKAREERLRENDFVIQASRTLSEQFSIINGCDSFRKHPRVVESPSDNPADRPA